MTISAGELRRPKDLYVNNSEVLWHHPTEDAERVGSRALAAFANIESPKDVGEFARRYGVLRICEHGKPASQAQECKPVAAYGWFREPLTAWFQFGRQARSMLSIAGDLRRGKPGANADWESIGGAPGRAQAKDVKQGRVRIVQDNNPYNLVTGPREMYWHSGTDRVEVGQSELLLLDQTKPYHVEEHPKLDGITPDMVKAQVVVERRWLAYAASEWLQLGGAAVAITWTRSTPRQVMTTHGLMGALAEQLVTHLTGGFLVRC